MNVFEFMAGSPVLTFFMFFSLLLAIVSVTKTIRSWCVLAKRHESINKHGWPPSHCDVDGFPRDVDVFPRSEDV